MKKGIFIDLVLIKVNGGVLNDESSVWREDIRAYIAAAVNYCVMQQYFTGVRFEGNRDMSGIFYGAFYDIPVLEDENRRYRKYFDLPKAVVPMPANQGIRFVQDNADETYKPLSDNGYANIKHYEKMFPGTRYFRIAGKRVYLYNCSPLLKTINAELIVDVDDLDDEDQLPIPAGLEDQAIDLCIGFFTGQRQIPTDKKNDKQDIN